MWPVKMSVNVLIYKKENEYWEQLEVAATAHHLLHISISFPDGK